MDKVDQREHWAAGDGHDEIMTLKEIAGYLKVSEKTISRMVQAGDLPGVKVANQWRFVRGVIDDWLDSRMYGASKQDLLRVLGTAPQAIPVARLVSEDCIVLNMQPGAKRAVLAALVDPLKASLSGADAEALVEELLAREDVVSTAIGRGVAFPHVRDPQDMPFKKPFVVLGVCPAGVDFGALDGGRTYVFAMPCAPSEVVHLQLMAKLSLLFREKGAIERIRAAPTKKGVVEALALAEAELPAAH